MPYVSIDFSDGHFDVRVLSDEEAEEIRAHGFDPPLVDGRVLSAWNRHLDVSVVWQTFWRTLDNLSAEKTASRDQYEIVFVVPGLPGECTRGPYTWNNAVSERNVVQQIDPNARIRSIETGEET